MTKQQYDLINSDEKFLWINGPAGAGKTVVLLAKMIQLALSSKDNKMVLFCQSCVTDDAMTPEYLHKPLEKAGVKHVSIFVMKMDATEYEIYLEIRGCLVDNQVVIIMLRSYTDNIRGPRQLGFEAQIRIICLCEGINMFFDDFQVRCNWDADAGNVNSIDDYVLPETLFDLSHSGYVWISYDTLQHPLFIEDEEVTLRRNSTLSRFFNDELSSTQLVSLSKNLRNTSDLSRTLSVIREHIIEQGQWTH